MLKIQLRRTKLAFCNFLENLNQNKFSDNGNFLNGRMQKTPNDSSATADYQNSGKYSDFGEITQQSIYIVGYNTENLFLGPINYETVWPSGPRRQTQVLTNLTFDVCSGQCILAWVQIPLLSNFFFAVLL
jgi:hypothetical protein